MIGIIILWMLADTSIWFALAGTVSACFGSSAFIYAMPLPAVCFGMSWMARGSRTARTCLSALSLAALFLPQFTLTDYIVYLPACLYACFTAYKEMYMVSADRLRENLRMLAKAVVIPAVICLFASKAYIIADVCAPCAACALLSSVTALRMLRHDPDVWLQKRYQLLNLISVAGVCLVSFLLSSRTALSAFILVILSIWLYLIAPLLQLTALVTAYVFYGIFYVVSLLFPSLEFEPDEIQINEMAGLFDQSEELQQMQETSPYAAYVVYALLFLAAALLIFLFFRRMLRSQGKRKYSGSNTVIRIDHEDHILRKPVRQSSDVRKIRKTYKTFLKYCAQKGMELRPSMTSTDAAISASLITKETTAAGELTKIYQNARYQETAGPEDTKKARDLLEKIRQDKSI